jgi:hypothetical protein
VAGKQGAHETHHEKKIFRLTAAENIFRMQTSLSFHAIKNLAAELTRYSVVKEGSLGFQELGVLLLLALRSHILSDGIF